jgi:sulfatase maturation enzyme AslB (radical SAM superfamily)
MIATLTELQRRHSINTMVWMGGEPLLRPDVLKRGVEIFPKNHVTTNGTLDFAAPGSSSASPRKWGGESMSI